MGAAQHSSQEHQPSTRWPQLPGCPTQSARPCTGSSSLTTESKLPGPGGRGGRPEVVPRGSLCSVSDGGASVGRPELPMGDSGRTPVGPPRGLATHFTHVSDACAHMYPHQIRSSTGKPFTARRGDRDAHQATSHHDSGPPTEPRQCPSSWAGEAARAEAVFFLEADLHTLPLSFRLYVESSDRTRLFRTVTQPAPPPP